MRRIILSAVLVLCGALLGAGLSVVLAWQDPASAPPLGGGLLQSDGSGNLVVSSGNLRIPASASNLMVEAGRAAFGDTTLPADTNQRIYVNGDIQVGSATNPSKGITLFDGNGSAYCLKVASGTISLPAGACM